LDVVENKGTFPSQSSSLFATSATEQVCTASLENTTVHFNNRFSAGGTKVDESSYVVFLVPRGNSDWRSRAASLICWRRRTA